MCNPIDKIGRACPLFFNGNEKPQKFRQHYWGIKMGITLSYGFHENINAAFILMTENANAALPDWTGTYSRIIRSNKAFRFLRPTGEGHWRNKFLLWNFAWNCPLPLSLIGNPKKQIGTCQRNKPEKAKKKPDKCPAKVWRFQRLKSIWQNLQRGTLKKRNGRRRVLEMCAICSFFRQSTTRY